MRGTVCRFMCWVQEGLGSKLRVQNSFSAEHAANIRFMVSRVQSIWLKHYMLEGLRLSSGHELRVLVFRIWGFKD